MSKRRIKSKSLTYFLITFCLSWAIWVPLMLVRLGLFQAAVPSDALVSIALPGVIMPSVVAILMSIRSGGEGVGGLLRRLFVWRVGIRWWLFVLLLQPAMLLLTAWLLSAVWKLGPLNAPAQQSQTALLVTSIFLLVASVGEELGWRGYALPRLQEEYSPGRSALVLGLITATWHLPYWVLQGILDDFGLGYLILDYLFIIALTIQIVVVFNRTRGSVLMPVVFHVVFNVFNVALLPVTSTLGGFAILTTVEWFVAAAMIGRLGFAEPSPSIPENEQPLLSPA